MAIPSVYRYTRTQPLVASPWWLDVVYGNGPFLERRVSFNRLDINIREKRYEVSTVRRNKQVFSGTSLLGKKEQLT